MRASLALLVLSAAAVAQPPAVPDFVRLKGFRDALAIRQQQLAAEEDFAKKPDEEKMVICYHRGDKKFGKDELTGPLVVRTILKWENVQNEKPSDAGKRALSLLPDALRQRYAAVIDVPRDRASVAKLLLEGLDSEYTPIRTASIASIMAIYRTMDPKMYEPTMNKKERAEAIKKWQKHVTKYK